METTSTKQEILNDLKELKNKGVKVIMHEKYLEKSLHGTLVFNGGCIVSGTPNDSEAKVRLVKTPEELVINIYLNSSEEDIKMQLSSVKSQLISIENSSKSSAIVDFLKTELK